MVNGLPNEVEEFTYLRSVESTTEATDQDVETKLEIVKFRHFSVTSQVG